MNTRTEPRLVRKNYKWIATYRYREELVFHAVWSPTLDGAIILAKKENPWPGSTFMALEAAEVIPDEHGR